MSNAVRDPAPPHLAALRLVNVAARVADSIPQPPPAQPPANWTLLVSDAAAAVFARRAFRAHLDRYAAPGSDVHGAELIFAELASNVVRHAPGPAAFYLRWRGTRPVLVVLDRGAGFHDVPARCIFDVSSEHGRGLGLVQALGIRTRMGNRNGDGAYVFVTLPISR